VKIRSLDDLQPWLDQVAATHENGWKTGSRGWEYPFDRNFTRRLILRSQGTVLSAKTLTRAKVPGKYFGVVRCFRYDKVDATHQELAVELGTAREVVSRQLKDFERRGWAAPK